MEIYGHLGNLSYEDEDSESVSEEYDGNPEHSPFDAVFDWVRNHCEKLEDERWRVKKRIERAKLFMERFTELMDMSRADIMLTNRHGSYIHSLAKKKMGPIMDYAVSSEDLLMQDPSFGKLAWLARTVPDELTKEERNKYGPSVQPMLDRWHDSALDLADRYVTRKLTEAEYNSVLDGTHSVVSKAKGILEKYGAQNLEESVAVAA